MEMARQLLAAGIVFGLLAAAWWALRRRGGAPGWLIARGVRGPLEARARLPLSPSHSVHLVRARGRALLMVVYPGGCTVVSNDPWTGDPGADL